MRHTSYFSSHCASSANGLRRQQARHAHTNRVSPCHAVRAVRAVRAICVPFACQARARRVRRVLCVRVSQAEHRAKSRSSKWGSDPRFTTGRLSPLGSQRQCALPRAWRARGRSRSRVASFRVRAVQQLLMKWMMALGSQLARAMVRTVEFGHCMKRGQRRRGRDKGERRRMNREV
eukprot:6185936-Pleurochrysis_carterae.AAC.1